MLDTLIYNGMVITMKGQGLGIINNGAVGIKDHQIHLVGESDEIVKRYQAHRYIDARHRVVMPGLMDSHIHTGLGILRGVAQDIHHWMVEGLWPFAKHLEKRDIQIGSMVNIIEGIKAGTTTFCDYDSNMDIIVENHALIGSRARVAETINELPENIETDDDGLYSLDKGVGHEKLKKSIDLFHRWHGQKNGRITCLFGPQGPDMLSKELLLEVKNLAKKYDTKVHIHVAQGDRETEQMIRRYGKRSIPLLQEIGYLDDRIMAVHLTVANREETKVVAQSNAAMILCSGSIGIIDGIVPPVQEFLKHSHRVALGSDQAPGNNCNNMFNEMKLTSILNKCRAKDPTIFPAGMVLRMATIEGAKSIGLGEVTGSLEIGKRADIIIIDMNQPSLCPIIKSPIRTIVPNLVYSARGHEVETVIIDGEVVMEEREIKTIDEEEYILKAHSLAEKIGERAQKEFSSKGTWHHPTSRTAHLPAEEDGLFL